MDVPAMAKVPTVKKWSPGASAAAPAAAASAVCDVAAVPTVYDLLRSPAAVEPVTVVNGAAAWSPDAFMHAAAAAVPVAAAPATAAPVLAALSMDAPATAKASAIKEGSPGISSTTPAAAAPAAAAVVTVAPAMAASAPGATDANCLSIDAAAVAPAAVAPAAAAPAATAPAAATPAAAAPMAADATSHDLSVGEAVVAALLDSGAEMLRALVAGGDSSSIVDTLMARVDASPEALIAALAEPTTIMQMVKEYSDPGGPTSVGGAIANALLSDDAKLLRGICGATVDACEVQYT